MGTVSDGEPKRGDASGTKSLSIGLWSVVAAWTTRHVATDRDRKRPAVRFDELRDSSLCLRRSISLESRRKFPDLQQSAERAILKLRSLVAPKTGSQTSGADAASSEPCASRNRALVLALADSCVFGASYTASAANRAHPEALFDGAVRRCRARCSLATCRRARPSRLSSPCSPWAPFRGCCQLSL